MSESDKPQSTTKDKLIADMKRVVTDAEELLRATADQAGEKVDGLLTRLQENLKATQGRLAEAETTLAAKTTVAFREALQQISAAAKKAAEATREAAQKAEEAAEKAAEPGKEAAGRAADAAREAARKAAAAAREIADKALDAAIEMARKSKDAIKK